MCAFFFQSSWKCQLAFCKSPLNNALCFVSKPPLGSFYGRFLLEEDMSVLGTVQVGASPLEIVGL